LRVLHIIPWLQQGGSEAMLASLVGATKDVVQHRIYTLLPSENFFHLDPAIIRCGAARRGIPSIGTVLDLHDEVKRQRPKIVHAWMYHANLASSVLWGRRPSIVWSIHNSTLPGDSTKRSTRLVNRLCARLSTVVPDKIVYVSAVSRDLHESLGYAAAKGVLIPNGVDPARFSRNRTQPRRNTGNESPATLAMVARYEHQKGHHFLIDVLAQHPARDRMRLIFAGRDCDTSPDLRAHLGRVGLLEQSTISGAVRLVEDIYAAADIVVLPSLYGEALPLTLLEASAAGRVICASRVGDIARMGLSSSFLFDAGDAASCAAALTDAMDAARIPVCSSRRLPDRYTIGSVACQYVDLYRSLTQINDRRAGLMNDPAEDHFNPESSNGRLTSLLHNQDNAQEHF
jgi:glycosyltransferase involved in cell wall biosynthesis